MWDSEISHRDKDSRSRTQHSLVRDRESCPLGRISLSHTRNNGMILFICDDNLPADLPPL